MAEAKTTKAKAAKPKVEEEAPQVEKLNETPADVAKEAAEELLNNEEEVPEKVDSFENTHEDKEAEETPENTASAEGPAEAEEAKEPSDPIESVTAEVSKEIEKTTEELKEFTENLDKKVKEVENAEPEKVAEVASEKIGELAGIEDNLKKEIEKEEAKLSTPQKNAAKKLFGRGFGDFWNGVSTGWEN